MGRGRASPRGSSLAAAYDRPRWRRSGQRWGEAASAGRGPARVRPARGAGGSRRCRSRSRSRPRSRCGSHAAGINPVDFKTRAGKGVAGVLGEPPVRLGWDVSGVVTGVPGGVTRFEVGDEVFGMPWFPRQAGAYAEYVTAPSRHFAAKPARPLPRGGGRPAAGGADRLADSRRHDRARGRRRRPGPRCRRRGRPPRGAGRQGARRQGDRHRPRRAGRVAARARRRRR